jgi:hypothetical protein
MIYTVFTAHGVVELEAKAAQVTAEGALRVIGETDVMIATWAPGSWRCVLDNAAYKAAFKAGTSDENSRRREAQRSLQAL